LRFGDWLLEIGGALRGERAADVPCDGCTACCRSSQFVHIAPDETDALAHIPPEVLFPAPLLPDGHVVLGYDEHGCCPMLTDDGCSIYEHRPRTCRTYDCRVFAATGIEVDKPLIAERVKRWRFDLTTAEEREAHDDLHVEAQRHTDLTPTQAAVTAVEEHLNRGSRARPPSRR
jgi:Fe-S-cluster containining protein